MKQRQSQRRKTRVFHVENPTFQWPEIPCAEIPAGYKLVAEVDTYNLDKAILLTNNVDQDWSLNVGVTAIVQPCRSTSVGDVIVTPDDEAYLILSRGYRRLGRV
ncbi:MAG: hypothetical protein KF841_03035 [Phycisphaerae bacterium]|nr:hypothetical protein [Phycisphaerae bacterium]